MTHTEAECRYRWLQAAVDYFLRQGAMIKRRDALTALSALCDEGERLFRRNWWVWL